MKLILGRSKTGKSKYIFDEMDNNKLSNKDVIYFVPSQMRVLAEENYMDFQNKPGIIDINFTTVASYIKDFLSEYKLNTEDKYISKLDRKLILTKVILNNPKIFNIFKKVVNKEGFLENLNIYMDIFKKEELSIDEISKISITDKFLESKLKEVTLIYEEYLKEIKDKYIDSIDEVDIFLNLFEDKYKNTDNTNTYIYFDSYNNFTNHEMKFIKLLIDLKFNLTFSITTDILDKLEDIEDLSYNEISNYLISDLGNIFDKPNLTLATLIKYAKKANDEICFELMRVDYSDAKEDIKYLAKNIFSDNINESQKYTSENVEISLTTNIYTEIDSIANIISKKIREGYRYKDFAIYTSFTDEYEYVVKKIFFDYNIPVFVDTKISIESNVLVKYIQKLILISKTGYTAEHLFQILKYGLNEISFEDISYIENYVLEFNLSGYKFEREFTINNSFNGKEYDITKLNEIREKIINTFSDFINFSKGKHTSKEIIKNIYDHLESSNIFVKYGEYIKEMKESNDPSVIYFANSSYLVWNSLSEIFSSIDKIYNEKEISISEFDKFLKYATKDISVKNIEPTLDQVAVLDINNSKTNVKKIIFLVGVNENKLPQKIEDDILFDDIELSKLEDLNIKFKETSISKLNMQLYNIYEVLNNVNEKIYISFVSSDTKGKSLRASSLIFVVKRILDVQVIGNVLNSNIENNIYSDKAALERFMYLTRNNDNIDNEALALYKYIFEYSNLKETLEYRRITDNLKTVKKEKFVTSVSKLELYKKCPFAYFMKYGLKLDERKIFSITSIDTGTFMHDVMEKFSLYLMENNINWHEILLDEEKYFNIIEDIITAELDRIFFKHKENIKYIILKEKLKNAMFKAIITVAKSFNQSKFLPFAYEVEFKDGGAIAPIEIKLSDNETMYIIGKIDRVDTLKLEEANYVRIVDYKSSSKDLNIDDIREGISLQLITYLSSFINSNKIEKALPAGMMYFTLSDKLVNLKEYTNNEELKQKKIIESLRMKGIFLKDVQVMTLMDNKIDSEERLVNVALKTVASDRPSLSLQTEEEFLNLFEEVKIILKNIGNEILSGNVEIKPNKKANHCKYCEYRSICRKDNMA